MKVWGSVAVMLSGLIVASNSAAQATKQERSSDAAASARGASAKPDRVILHWRAPPDCPTGEEVLDDARTLAVQKGTVAPKTATAVEGVVERVAEGRWRLTLAIGTAEQHVEASSCAQLARAGALFLTLIMDPSRAEVTADAAPPRPSAPPAKELAPQAATAGQPPEARATPRELSLRVAAGFIMDIGTLPRPEPLGALEIGLRYRRVEGSLAGAVGPAQEKIVSGAAGARLRPLSVTFLPCYALLATNRLRLGPCVSTELGSLHAEGLGVSQGRVRNAVWFSFGGELAGWVAVGEHFEARLGAGALVPIVHPNFELIGLGNVFEPGIAVRADLAAVVRF